jgi:hypothetical protein
MEQERVADAVLVVETAAPQQMRAVIVQLKSRTVKQTSSGGK